MDIAGSHLRRVVTGDNAEQSAVVVSDSSPPCYVSPQGIRRFEVWSTDTMPAPIDEQAHPDARVHGLVPPPNGTALKIVEFPPESAHAGSADEFLASASALVRGSHPGMHRTRTLDYFIILDGEIVLILDGSETVVRRGDIVIQRGTNHAWSNRSGTTCRVAFFMIDGQRATPSD